MANEILKFKKGLFADLDNAAKSAGTIYVTTDEHGMYVDVSATERVRISDIIQVASVRAAQPPYSTAAIYYFIEENALLKWDGTTWTQINSVKGVQDQINAITAELYAGKDGKGTAASPAADTVRKRLADLEAAFSALELRVDSAEDDIDVLEAQIWGTGSADAPAEDSILDKLAKYDTRITQAQTDATSGITKADAAQKAADAAQGTADAANTAAAAANTAAGNAQAAADAAQGDATQALADAAAAQEDATQALADAAAASTAAGNAQTAADAAQAAAKAAQTTADSKTTLAEVEAKGYATTGYVDNVKSELLGTSEDTSDKNTIYGAKKGIEEAKTAAASAQTAADNAQDAANAVAARIDSIEGDEGLINTKIEEAKKEINAEVDEKINAANAMNYEGDIAAYSNLPTTDTDNIKIGDTYVVTTKFVNDGVTYHAGDLLIANGTEDKGTGFIVSDLSWSHVKTGYIKEQESTLVATDLDKKITLTSYLNESLGGFKFDSVGDDEAGIKVTFNTDSYGITTIHLDQQWGSF